MGGHLARTKAARELNELRSPASASSTGWRVLDWVLVVVGVANLAGLIVVGRLAAARSPRNPFK